MQEELCPVAAFFGKAEKLVLRSEGRVRTVEKGEEFEKILSAWGETLKEGRQMPAFGVSIDEHTTRAMQSGVWVEFCFKKPLTIGEMPFEKLLIDVRPEYMGFNVSRYNADHGYQGRCYYIDLRGGNMSAFYNFITNFN